MGDSLEQIKLPKDWKRATLEKICLKPGEYGASVSKSDYNSLLPRYIRITDIKEDGSLSADNPVGISEKDAQPYLMNEGDIVFARSGATVGKTYLYNKNDGRCAFAGYLIRFQPNPDVIIPYFLKYFVQSNFYWKWVRNSQQAQAQPNINAKQYGSLSVPLPPIDEQKKIAEILGSVDESIAFTQAVIDQTRKVKQGLLQQLLTKGIGHTKFKESAIGKIPESWEVKSAKDICNQISVGIVVKPTQYYVKSGVPCFRSANVQEGYILDKDWVYISEESNKTLEKSRLRIGDVLVVRTGYPGTSCVVPENFDGANCIDIIFARPIKDIVLPEYLSWFINSSLGKKQVLQGQGGLAQQHFNVGSLNTMQISIPSLKEQQKIVDMISCFQESIVKSEVEREKLLSLKRGLMQDLLTGKVRVKQT